MSAVALVATLNRIIVQIIMSSRVLYGLSQQGDLHAPFGSVHPRTRTPVLATMLTTAAVLALALAVRLDHLADLTSRLTLIVFALVNLSLIGLKARTPLAPTMAYVAPAWVPWAGFASCAALLIADMLVTAGAFGS